MSQPVRNAALGAIAVVCFGTAIYLFATRSNQSAQLPGVYTYSGICLNCKNEGQATYNSGDVAPFKCPKCGQQAVYGWMYCKYCDKRSVPQLAKSEDGGPPSVPPIPPCPMCGRSDGYSAYDPKRIGHEAAVGPLPKWPQ